MVAHACAHVEDTPRSYHWAVVSAYGAILSNGNILLFMSWLCMWSSYINVLDHKTNFPSSRLLMIGDVCVALAYRGTRSYVCRKAFRTILAKRPGAHSVLMRYSCSIRITRAVSDLTAMAAVPAFKRLQGLYVGGWPVCQSWLRITLLRDRDGTVRLGRGAFWADQRATCGLHGSVSVRV